VKSRKEPVEEIAWSGNPDVHEVAAGEATAFSHDRANDALPIGLQFPHDGLGITIKAVVFEGPPADQDHDRGTLDVASFEGVTTDNTFVASEQGDADDLSGVW
jgi:hypothetical protein